MGTPTHAWADYRTLPNHLMQKTFSAAHLLGPIENAGVSE